MNFDAFESDFSLPKSAEKKISQKILKSDL